MTGSPLVLLRVTTLPFATLGRLAGRSGGELDALFSLESSLAAEQERLEAELYRAAGSPGEARDRDGVRARLALLRIRRAVHQRRAFDRSDLQAAASRLGPRLAELERHAGGLLRLQEVAAAALRAVGEDLDRGRCELQRAASHPLVEEGIWLASRSLSARLTALQDRVPGEMGREDRHALGKLAAYLVRFCTKTSPNALFCATALAEFADGQASLSGRAEIEKVDVVLNVAEARKVAACLAVGPEVDRAIFPRPNPTLRNEEDGWTYWRPASMRWPDEDEVRSRLKKHSVAQVFLEETARADHDVPSLLAAVAARCGIGPDELDPFYRTLVERGLLIGEVGLPYNARRPLRTLAERVRSAGCAPPWLLTVEAVEREVDRIPHLHGRDRREAMMRAGAQLEELPHVRPLHPDELFRVDAASALRVRLPGSLLEELDGGLRPYVRLFSAFYPERAYRAARVARLLRSFPPDTEIDLLDLYHGVFEPEQRRRPVAFPDPAEVAIPGVSTAQAARALAQAREHFARRARETGPGEEIAIADEEVRSLVGDAPEPRWACGVLFQIDARRAADVGAGQYRLVLNGLFQGAGLALARFAHLLGSGAGPHENPVLRELRACWRYLERDGAVLAELTYNHSYRTANAGLRPSMFDHEIELPGDFASPDKSVIPLGELTVRWDSGQDRFVLTWRRSGVEVIPVITSGVNPVGIISFLVDVGQQGLQPLGLFPGFDVEGIRHWPRIVAGRLVLFRGRWSFPAGQWPAASSWRESDEAEAVLRFALWRRRHALPQHVFVHTSRDPKPRYVDLDSPLLLSQLLRATAAEGAADLHLTEMLPGPDGLWVGSEGGGYASEFLVHRTAAPREGDP